jgi:hypothetical protein
VAEIASVPPRLAQTYYLKKIKSVTLKFLRPRSSNYFSFAAAAAAAAF